MKDLKDYEIKFSGLQLGKHEFDFQLDKEFFTFFDYHDFRDANVNGHLTMEKKPNGLELNMSISGRVTVPCDITTELYQQEISGEMVVMVKFGDEYDDSNEEILVLPMGEHQINVGQYLYETTVLSVPLKLISPEVIEGKKGKEILKKLEALSPQEKQNEKTDPRWDKLKDLLN